MNLKQTFVFIALIFIMMSCKKDQSISFEAFETSASGNQLAKIDPVSESEEAPAIRLFPEETFQTITGMGGSFTESSAYLLNQLGKENRRSVLEAYFGEEGAKYSLTRTHINSCDFSLSNYSYAPVENDINLDHFSIAEDEDDIIPMIKEAMDISKDGFKIISSPWTAPPWMKDNKDWKGGKLLPEYYETWALFFSKYISAYKNKGIEIWGVTVENEPLGNSSNWESMHYTAEEMTNFVQHFLGPKLEKDGLDVKILGYDQNRDAELKSWVDVMYASEESSKYFDGTAVHWYASTFEWFPEALQYAHDKAPDKHLIQTEGCVDAEVPAWKDDNWYWSKEATDWGWDWASEEDKYLHPKYVPVFRYARDIIGCLNNWVDGWVDWNMVLDKQGGPNWAKNWCVAPVIVDPEKDEVYFTPIYYTLAQFSRFIRPGAKRIGFENLNKDVMATALVNPDGTLVLVLFNQNESESEMQINLGEKRAVIKVNPKSIMTLVIQP